MNGRLLLLLSLSQLVGCSSCTVRPGPFGRFEGRVLTEWDKDGRFMILQEPFAYFDASNKRWSAPVGARINGASIPQPFWSLIGGPFEGQYRNASVVHDVYCETMSESWEDVHEMFYHACRCGGVSESKAKLMYWAVYHFGPHWERTKDIDGKSAAPVKSGPEAPDKNTIAAAKTYFEANNPSLEDIKRLEITPR